MTIERTINIDGREYPLVLSDDVKTLLAAKAAGRVVVGIGSKTPGAGALGKETSKEGKMGEETSAEWLPVRYVADTLPVDEAWLEGVAHRELGIPWKIAGTDRLIIREFSVSDCPAIPGDADDSSDEAILRSPERLQSYIEEQYAFFDCGMWAMVRREDGQIVGMLSLTPFQGSLPGDPPRSLSGDPLFEIISADPLSGDPLYEIIYEIGYHVYAPYRRNGYAREACGKILELLDERKIAVIARTDPENIASLALLKSLGFEQVSSDCFLHREFV